MKSTRKKAPLHIRSLEDARDWLQETFGEEGALFREGNQVLLREGIVLCGSIVYEHDVRGSRGWKWAIINDRKDVLASNYGLKFPDWAEEAARLWRACLAWGPAQATRYVYATTCEDSTTKEVSTPTGGWELQSFNVVPVQGLPRLYYHWRKAMPCPVEAPVEAPKADVDAHGTKGS